MKRWTILAAMLAGLAAAQNLGFHFYGVTSRYVTPHNGVQGHSAVFCFDNPNHSGVTGQVYTLFGSQVVTFISGQDGTQVAGSGCSSSNVGACTYAGAACNYVFVSSGTIPGSLEYSSWDGTANGSFVHSGLYLYRVRAEGGTYTGTLMVVK